MEVVAKILSLEVTQDCNLCCRHCLNGCVSDKVMSEEVIRRIFKSVKGVEELLLTGGEVFLSYETVKRILEIAKEENCDILSCTIITNGCIYDARIYDLLEEYFKDDVEIYISSDDFHDKSIGKIYSNKYEDTDEDKCLRPHSIKDVQSNMLKHMEHRFFVDFQELGNKLIDVGRAKYLKGDKHPYEALGYFYDYGKNGTLLVGPVVFISAEGYIADGNDEIESYERHSLGNVLVDDLGCAIINGGIHVLTDGGKEFFSYLDERMEEYQHLRGKHYIIEDKKMKVIDIRPSRRAEEEVRKFLDFIDTECEDGLTIDKILQYDFSSYPYDLSLVDHGI